MSNLPPARQAKAARSALSVPRRFWLLKSEPDVFSWEMLKARGSAGEPWTGVRNYQARNNMRAMVMGDLAFFYHSNIGKEVVGVMRVIATARAEPGDETGKWMCVDVEAVCDLPRAVPLEVVKQHEGLTHMALAANTRLSVQPVTPVQWDTVCELGGLTSAALASALRRLG